VPVISAVQTEIFLILTSLYITAQKRDEEKAVYSFLLAATLFGVDFTDEPDLSGKDKKILYNMIQSAIAASPPPFTLDQKTNLFL